MLGCIRNRVSAPTRRFFIFNTIFLVLFFTIYHYGIRGLTDIENIAKKYQVADTVSGQQQILDKSADANEKLGSNIDSKNQNDKPELNLREAIENTVRNVLDTFQKNNLDDSKAENKSSSDTTSKNSTSPNTSHITTSSTTTTTTANKTPEPVYHVYSRFIGRLGNHMFIYASMVGIALSQGRIPLISNKQTRLVGAFELTHIGNTDRKTVQVGEKAHAIFKEEDMHLPKGDLTITGFRQSWKYFANFTDHIRKEFTFKPDIQKKADQILEKCLENQTYSTLIGIHVRRGDFLISRHKNAGYTAAPFSYFQKAMEYMKTKHATSESEKIIFLLACTDKKWCTDNFNSSDVIMLPEESDTVHMAILKRCNHTVFSAGTYGWWAAFLAGGDAVYYKGFPLPHSTLLRGFKHEDHYLPQWIGMWE